MRAAGISGWRWGRRDFAAGAPKFGLSFMPYSIPKHASEGTNLSAPIAVAAP
jgi:hypothetical protein